MISTTGFVATPDYSQLLQSTWYSAQEPSGAVDSDPNTQTIHIQPHPHLDLTDYLGETLAWKTTFESRDAEFVPLPTTLPPSLRNALTAQGITQLYTHQAKTYRAVRAGKDVVLTVPTAAGKTLAAYIPVLERAIESGSTCLSLYGLKALASDQSAKLSSLLQAIPGSNKPRFIKLTGDVPREERRALLATQPHVVAITPDLLHWELNQVYWSDDWKRFLSTLHYVVIDELHSYSGVFGANTYWLLQRLKLAVDTWGGNSKALQFISLSATVGNPKELASRLTGRSATHPDGSKRLVSIRQSGAYRPTKQLVVTQPSSSGNAQAAKLMVFLMQQGLRGITFCNSINTTKKLVGLVETELTLQNCLQLRGKVASFYSSLDDRRREQIISNLETNNPYWIVSTSALEAGIDLPQVDVSIILGFPGTLLSFQQRIGRCGRQNKGLGIYIPRTQRLLDTYFSDATDCLPPAKRSTSTPTTPSRLLNIYSARLPSPVSNPAKLPTTLAKLRNRSLRIY